jgi:tetratricopeptide (TPR) repeat protein
MGNGGYYLVWLVAPLVLSGVTRHPVIAGIAVLGFLLRRWLPDPFVFLKYSGRVAALRRDIAANPHNAAAQRELALIYLEKRRPRPAVPLLTAALERDPDSPDLHHHLGRALLGCGRWQDAVDHLVTAVTADPRLAYGDPYLHAGDALMRLRRFDDAEESFSRAVAVNASSVEGQTKLGLARAARGDRPGAGTAFTAARATYHQLPGYGKRRAWTWALRAWWHS